MVVLLGQGGNGDRDRRRWITVEEHVVQLPAQAAQGVDRSPRISELQTGQILPGEVDGTAPRGHHRRDQLSVGTGQGQ